SSASSASVSSSVYKFVQEHGRTFHKYKEGKYFLPNDKVKQNRLAEENPNSEILGTDLSPIQPDYLPPNCRFEIDDVDDDWVHNHKFDYIHGRYLLPFVKKDWSVFFKSIYDNLNPGGWVESQETIIYFQSIDGSVEGTALQRWNALLLRGIQMMGRSATEALRCKNYLAEAGFVNLGEKKFAVPMNPWAKGDDQKAVGAMQMANNFEGIDGITMTVFTRALGWAPADVEKLLVDVKNDFKDRSIHGYITVIVVWGQKPQ
ncbi:S-adenosyl-L-methionine-dependent methyltransferase, partial [Chaetomium tenue]